MSLFDYTDKHYKQLPDLNKPKRLSKILGSNFMLNKIRSLGSNDISNFRMGAFGLCVIFSSMGYYFYRQYYSQKMMSSTYYYKLNNLEPLNAGRQFVWNEINEDDNSSSGMTYYYRMPKKEFDVKFRMRSAFITGEFDHDKEILIPRRKDGVEGYDVFTPLYYYYYQTKTDLLDLLHDGKPVEGNKSERGALPVHRGWIPFQMKDRRLRPYDLNKSKETIHGTIKLSPFKNHDFNTPNDPTKGYWNNYCLEDMARYWELPNVFDAKYCYFQEINFKDDLQDVHPVRPTVKQAIIQDSIETGFRMDRNYKRLTYGATSVGAFFAYLFYLAA